MKENRNNQKQQSNPGPTPQQTGSKEQENKQQHPNDRLKDGTNDFQSGDQDKSSERSSKPGDPLRNV